MSNPLKVEENKVVSLHYDVTDDEGNLVDSSKGVTPLSYLHGRGNIIPGLEESLEGRNVDEEFNVTIQPENAYGFRDENMKQVVPRADLSSIKDLQVGMHIQATTDQGPILLVVVELDNENVTLDANHPLAGKVLNFKVKIVAIRDATKIEIEKGHLLKEDCCSSSHCDDSGCSHC